MQTSKRVLVLFFFAITASAVSLWGQTAQKKNSLPTLGSKKSKLAAPKELELSSRYHLVTGTRKGVLIVKARIPEGSYIYSMTQKGDIPPTRIGVKRSQDFKITGKFSADRTAEIVPNDPIMKCRVEKHKKMVQFFVPIELRDGVDPAKLTPELSFETQICSSEGFCQPIRGRRIAAKFGGYFRQQAQKSQNLRQLKR